MTPLKAAVVGTGYLGTFHAEKYYSSAAAELCAVVDVCKKSADKCARRFKTRSFEDYRELESLDIDCASIATTTSTHYEVASWLLERGVDVLVEKPVTVECSQAESLIALARREGRILQVGHLERFNPAFVRIKRKLTEPRFFEARRIAPFTGRGCDVDVVLDLMIHDIDIIAHLVSKPLYRVDAVGVPVLTESVDIANARLTFEGGAVANITASRAALKSERTIRMFQPDVYISLDFAKRRYKIYTRKEDLGGGGSVGGLFSKLFTGVNNMPSIDIENGAVEDGDALGDEIESFLSCVSSRAEPVVTGEDALRALQMVEAVRRAFKEAMDGVFLGESFANGPLR